MILREAVRIPALIAACQPLLVAEERFVSPPRLRDLDLQSVVGSSPRKQYVTFASSGLDFGFPCVKAPEAAL